MRFYLDYTVCVTPYLAHDTYLHGISVPSRRVKTSLSKRAHKVTTMSDGANFTFSIVSIRRYIKMTSQDIASLLSGIVDNKESYKRD